MNRASANKLIVWLTLASYLLVALGGVAVVLCEGADDHVGIELAHERGACNTLSVEHALVQPVLQNISSPVCQDTPLDELALVEPVPPRTQSNEIRLLPAPLLPQLAWAEPGNEVLCKIDPLGPPPVPFQRDVIQSVVLLI